MAEINLDDLDFNGGFDVEFDDPLFTIVYNKVKKAVKNKKITSANVIILVTLCMQIVAKIPDLAGGQKRDLVIKLITKLVLELEMEEDERAAIQILLQTSLPFTIDALIAASKQQYDFKKIGNKMRKLFACCRPVE